MPEARELKPGEVATTDTVTSTGPELVRVHHTGLNRTMVVRRAQLAQMDPAWEPVEAEELKGAALDKALDDAELPKTGSADEKRARLAEHEATNLAATSESSRDAAVITTTENTEE